MEFDGDERELCHGLQPESGEGTEAAFSEIVLDHCFNPRNWGMIPEPHGTGKGSRVCGDGLEIALRVKDDRVIDAKFFTEGCGPMLAAGSMATELVIGKTISEAFKITSGAINQALGGLPQESEHCADTAAEALGNALRDYLALKREPWKRGYKK